MSKTHRWRLCFLSLCLVLLTAIVCLVLFALRQNINLFYTPSELWQHRPVSEVRLGGEVKRQTLKKKPGLKVSFSITDYVSDVDVQYQGVLPDLFREGHSVVARGVFADDRFIATQILAKHDEKYTPSELSHKLQDK